MIGVTWSRNSKESLISANRRSDAWLHLTDSNLYALSLEDGAIVQLTDRVGPDGQPDPVLSLGRDVYASRCSNCHGSSGGGGTGPRLAGSVEDSYPDPADQALVVAEGRRNMPSFGGTLSDDEIDAVVRYTR